MTLDLAAIRARAESGTSIEHLVFFPHAREDVLALIADIELGQKVFTAVVTWLDQNEADISLPAFKALGAILDEIKP